MKEVTKHSGKRSIGLPGIVSFLHGGKGSQGHVLSRSGLTWPTWNIPKKCFFSQERGWKSWARSLSRKPSTIQEFWHWRISKILFRFRDTTVWKKSAGMKKSVIVNLGFCWQATLDQFWYGRIITAVVLQSTKIALTMHHAVDIIYPLLQLVQRYHDKGGGLSSVLHKQWIFQ